MNQSDVFVSYRRVDKVFTRRLVEALRQQQMTVWIDWEDIPPGSEDFTEDIQRGVSGADVFVAVLSPAYLESEYCLGELQLAADMNKRIIPIVLEKFEDRQIPGSISHVNWVYFTPHVGELNDFDEAFPRLLQAISMDQEHLLMHTRLLLRAQEWEASARNNSFVLKGVELKEAEAWQTVAGHKDPPPTDLHNEYIFASRTAENNRLRRTLFGVSVALVLSVVLAVVATYFLIQSQILNEEVESLLWSNHSQQVMNTGDNLLAVTLARQAVENSNNLTLLDGLSLLNIDAPPLSQRILSAAGYLPGARQRLTAHTASVWAMDSYGTLNGDWRAVSGDASGLVNIWNLQGDAPEATRLGTHDSSIWAVAMSSDGTAAVTASADGTLSMWNTVTLIRRWTVETPDIVWSVAFSRDGNYILTGDLGGTLILRSADTGEELDSLSEHNGAIWAVAASPTGDFVASGGAGGVINLNQIVDGELVNLPRSLKVNIGLGRSAIWSLAFSTNGRRLAAGLEDRRILMIDPGQFQLVDTLEGHSDRVVSLAFSPTEEADALISGAVDGDIFIWNMTNTTLQRRFRSHDDAVWSLNFSPDSRRMLSASADNSLIIWDRFSGAQAGEEIPLNDSITALATSIQNGNTDQSYLAASTRNGSIYIMRPDDEILLLDVLPDDVTDLAFSPTRPNQLAAASHDAILHIWNRLGQLTSSARYQGHRDRLWSVDYHPEGRYIVTGSADQSAIIWDVGRTEPFVRLTNGETNQGVISSGHLDEVLAAKFVPGRDNLTVLTGGADNRLLLWQLDNENNISSPLELTRPDGSPAHENDVQALAISPDGRYALSGGADDTVVLWNLESRQFVDELTSEHTDAVNDILFVPATDDATPQDSYLAVTVGSDGRVLTWEIHGDSRPELLRAYEQDAGMLSVAYDPLRRIIYTGSDTASIIPWRLDTLDGLLAWIGENRRADALTPDECQRYSPEPDVDCQQPPDSTSSPNTGLPASSNVQSSER